MAAKKPAFKVYLQRGCLQLRSAKDESILAVAPTFGCGYTTNQTHDQARLLLPRIARALNRDTKGNKRLLQKSAAALQEYSLFLTDRGNHHESAEIRSLVSQLRNNLGITPLKPKSK